MIVRYCRNFYAVGRGTHVVEVFESYTPEQGLEGKIERRESGRMTDCLRGLDLHDVQVRLIKELGRIREDGIVLESGEFRSY